MFVSSEPNDVMQFRIGKSGIKQTTLKGTVSVTETSKEGIAIAGTYLLSRKGRQVVSITVSELPGAFTGA